MVSWLAAKNRKKLPSVHPSVSTATGPSTQPKPELTEQLRVDDEVTLAAEKLELPFEVDDHKSDESDYYSDFEND